MRKFRCQPVLGCPDISSILLDVKSRDEVNKLLFGIQQCASDSNIMTAISNELELIAPKTKTNQGRVGMDLWTIFILSMLKTVAGYDYDKLHDQANNHNTIRNFIGLGSFQTEVKFAYTTIRENIQLFTVLCLDRINQILCKYGLNVLGFSETDTLDARIDSFVVKTDVEFPVDHHLLYTAVRKASQLIMRLLEITKLEKKEFYNVRYDLVTLKKLHIELTRCKANKTRKDDAQKLLVAEKYEQLVEYSYKLIDQVKLDMKKFNNIIDKDNRISKKVKEFIAKASLLINQIERRVFEDEVIPPEEKIFSLFKGYTEWIQKGKIGLFCELGVQVCIVESNKFILHHKVMYKQADSAIAREVVSQTKNKYANLSGVSFDCGFYSEDNANAIKKMIKNVCLPKKGGRKANTQPDEDYIARRRKHAGVESSIHGLQCSGLDKCKDYGEERFEKHISLSIVARNFFVLGSFVQQKLNERFKKAA